MDHFHVICLQVKWIYGIWFCCICAGAWEFWWFLHFDGPGLTEKRLPLAYAFEWFCNWYFCISNSKFVVHNADLVAWDTEVKGALLAAPLIFRKLRVEHVSPFCIRCIGKRLIGSKHWSVNLWLGKRKKMFLMLRCDFLFSDLFSSRFLVHIVI